LLAAPKLPTHAWRRCFEREKRVFPTSHFKRWQLQEAKAKFSELFDRAVNEGPQVVTRRNKEAVVVIPEAEFRKLAEGPAKPAPGMLETLLKCPKGPALKIERDPKDSVLNLPRVFD
jgi:prevent-host-death family protein